MGAKSTPRRKQMNRKSRLAHARSTQWLALNKGAKNLVRRYRRYFGVDLLTAALELRALGVSIPEARLEQLRLTASQSKKAPGEAAALARELERCWPVWSDVPFPFPVDEWEPVYHEAPLSPPLAEHEMGPSEEEWAAIMEREDEALSENTLCPEPPFSACEPSD